ncbi:hypothetical protein B566_EDAN012918 [Ephemera danica]|nr:hypothetical protein B566_EDAN012918 [Ephemera danica]
MILLGGRARLLALNLFGRNLVMAMLRNCCNITGRKRDGVVVLSSTDCSSSSSACSGHSDITSDPGSPYSSPTSAALCSPEEFPGSHSEESEDSPPSPSAVDELTTLSDEPRPPDPICWPSFNTDDKPSRLTKKRPYPFWTSPSTAKEEMCVQPVLVLEQAQRDSKLLSLLSEAEQTMQPVAESKHQEDALSRDSKDVELTPSEPEKRVHRRLSLDTAQSRPQNGETELYTKCSDKLSLLTTSVDTSKVFSDKELCVVNRVSVAIDEVTRASPDKVTPTTLSRDSVTMVETITRGDEKKAIRVIEVVESRSCEGVASLPEAENKTEIATPMSPILSVPRVIRFPVPQRIQTGGVDGTVESSIHVNTQMRSEQFVCLWVGCKVHARPSCSLTWLERHVLSHGGSKPFRCIVDGCGQRFSSQSSLERHVNSHFNAPSGVNGSGSASSTARRSTDTAPNKLFRRNGKKLRYRRQPWSARMFDYIDTGMMEGVQHRLLTFTGQQMRNVTSEMQEQQISQGNHLALRSKVIARRVEMDGTTKFLVRWVPEDIIPDEWMSESEVKPSQLVPLSRLSPSASTHLHHSLLPPNSKSTRKPRKPRVPATAAAAGVTTRARSLS